GSTIPSHPEADLVIGRLPTSNPAFGATVDATSSATLEAGQTALIDVSYLPSGVAGGDSATLTVLSNVTSSPAPVIRLIGQGIDVGPCSYAVAPTQLDWGAVSGADRSLHTLALTITNLGPNLCVIDALRLSDSDTGAFTLPGGAIASQLLAPPGTSQMVD